MRHGRIHLQAVNKVNGVEGGTPWTNESCEFGRAWRPTLSLRSFFIAESLPTRPSFLRDVPPIS